MTEINKEFIDKTNNLIVEKEKLETEIDIRLNYILNRTNKIIVGHKKALDELMKEFKNDYAFNYGFYNTNADKDIKEIKDNKTYFTANIMASQNGGDYFHEEIDVPYNPEEDEAYVEKFKQEQKQEYIAEQEEKLTKEKQKYLELKKKFEG